MEKQYDIYEYITVRIKYSLAEDCRTCYESFGWETIQERISNDGKKLQFRRRRNIAERGRLMEQQRRMENAMAQVEHYENQRELVPIMICILVGLAGAGVLAYAIISLTQDRLVPFFIFQVIGVVLCTVPVPMKGWLTRRRKDLYAAEIAEQKRIIEDTSRRGQEILQAEVRRVHP